MSGREADQIPRAEKVSDVERHLLLKYLGHAQLISWMAERLMCRFWADRIIKLHFCFIFFIPTDLQIPKTFSD